MQESLVLILSGRMDLTRELISHLSYLSTSAAQILPYFEAVSISDIQRHNPQAFMAFWAQVHFVSRTQGKSRTEVFAWGLSWSHLSGCLGLERCSTASPVRSPQDSGTHVFSETSLCVCVCDRQNPQKSGTQNQGLLSIDPN